MYDSHEMYATFSRNRDDRVIDKCISNKALPDDWAQRATSLVDLYLKFEGEWTYRKHENEVEINDKLTSDLILFYTPQDVRSLFKLTLDSASTSPLFEKICVFLSGEMEIEVS